MDKKIHTDNSEIFETEDIDEVSEIAETEDIDETEPEETDQTDVPRGIHREQRSNTMHQNQRNQNSCKANEY